MASQPKCRYAAPRRLRRIVAALALAFLDPVAAMAEPPSSADPLAPVRIATKSAEARTREAMRTVKVSAKFEKEPLSRAVVALAAKGGLKNVRIDEAAWKEEGVGLDELTEFEVKDALLESAFRKLLEPYGLAWQIEHELLVVTAQVRVNETHVTRFHDIRELRAVFADANRTPRVRRRTSDSPFASTALASQEYPDDVRDLIETVLQETSGPWLELDGTGGELMPLGPALHVRQTEKVQDEIADLLQNVLGFAKSRPLAPVSNLHLHESAKLAERKQFDALARTIGPLEFTNVPLKSLVSKLAELSGGSIVPDETLLMEEGLSLDTPLTFASGPVTLRNALRAIFEPLSIRLIVEDGFILLTSRAKSDEKLSTFVYDVRDMLQLGWAEDDLAAVLINDSSGPWEEVDSTGGTLAMPLPGMFIIRQKFDVHEEVQKLLTELREKKISREKRSPGDGNQRVEFYSLERKGQAPQMEKALTVFVAPETWDANGGKGTIRCIDDVLIVRQTSAVHRKIQEFLADFKKAQDNPKKDPEKALPSPARFRGF